MEKNYCEVADKGNHLLLSRINEEEMECRRNRKLVDNLQTRLAMAQEIYDLITRLESSRGEICSHNRIMKEVFNSEIKFCKNYIKLSTELITMVEIRLRILRDGLSKLTLTETVNCCTE
jgi:DNA-binding winged helix-turn-helix (wHTH) protein